MPQPAMVAAFFVESIWAHAAELPGRRQAFSSTPQRRI